MKKGDTIKFNFHGFGEISVEEATVDNVTDGIVQIEAEDIEYMYKFSISNGRCLNDNTSMGCHRSLHDDHIEGK